MNLSLDFERPILALEAQIRALRMSTELSTTDLMTQISTLEKQCELLTEETFSKLTIWQTVQLARHELRPQFMDYVAGIFTDFEELHGDRHFADDQAVIGGLARLEDRPVMLIGTQKGKDTKERTRRNFGMPRPEGYRKALRLMEMAEKFGLPIITLVDTAGAYPGIDAEERNQSEAIARNLLVMARLKTPIVSIITGEGGSGGALALSVADHLVMLQYSVYSVISPEGCASILWRAKDKAADAAEAMNMSASKIMEHKLIDGLIPEPLGGAHRDVPQLMRDVKSHLISAVGRLSRLSDSERLEKRYDKLMRLGQSVIREN